MRLQISIKCKKNRFQTATTGHMFVPSFVAITLYADQTSWRLKKGKNLARWLVKHTVLSLADKIDSWSKCTVTSHKAVKRLIFTESEVLEVSRLFRFNPTSPFGNKCHWYTVYLRTVKTISCFKRLPHTSWKAHNSAKLSDERLETLIRVSSLSPSAFATVFIRECGCSRTHISAKLPFVKSQKGTENGLRLSDCCMFTPLKHTEVQNEASVFKVKGKVRVWLLTEG